MYFAIIRPVSILASKIYLVHKVLYIERAGFSQEAHKLLGPVSIQLLSSAVKIHNIIHEKLQIHIGIYTQSLLVKSKPIS